MTKVMLRTMLKENIVLKKRTESLEHSVFGTKNYTYTDYNIKGCVQFLTLEDLRFLEPGIFKVGDARGYFFDKYKIGLIEVSVAVGDHIVKDGVECEVEAITPHGIHKENVIEARLGRI